MDTKIASKKTRVIPFSCDWNSKGVESSGYLVKARSHRQASLILGSARTNLENWIQTSEELMDG